MQVKYTSNVTPPISLNSGKDITKSYINRANININTLLIKDPTFNY